ncbi:hypothetical protein CYY_010433 [Polysphondylium violaceum]|uniref:Uncharacterized protein n=1 Tax=Polysphondylium violaceum TaxID=133409 RepID=A0A8J4PJV0_9MYCE|nr:hypothetical protein CYY_010433 [Polysphondylium violaceum]
MIEIIVLNWLKVLTLGDINKSIFNILEKLSTKHMIISQESLKTFVNTNKWLSESEHPTTALDNFSNEYNQREIVNEKENFLPTTTTTSTATTTTNKRSRNEMDDDVVVDDYYSSNDENETSFNYYNGGEVEEEELEDNDDYYDYDDYDYVDDDDEDETPPAKNSKKTKSKRNKERNFNQHINIRNKLIELMNRYSRYYSDLPMIIISDNNWICDLNLLKEIIVTTENDNLKQKAKEYLEEELIRKYPLAYPKDTEYTFLIRNNNKTSDH